MRDTPIVEKISDPIGLTHLQLLVTQGKLTWLLFNKVAYSEAKKGQSNKETTWLELVSGSNDKKKKQLAQVDKK